MLGGAKKDRIDKAAEMKPRNEKEAPPDRQRLLFSSC